MISLHSSPLGEIGTRDTGGMSIYIRRLAGALAGHGHGIDIFTRRQHPMQESVVGLTERVRVIHLDAGGCEPLPPPALSAHLREFTAGLNRMRSTESVAYDLVHSHYWLSGQVGRCVARGWRVPHVIVFHTLGKLKNRVFEAPVEPETRLRAERDLCADSHRIIATTEAEKSALVELYGAPGERVAVIPCGVDLTGFQPVNRGEARHLLGVHQDDPLVLYVGRFDPVKGLDDLLTAMALIRADRPVRLMVVGGDGDAAAEARSIRELSARLGVSDRVTFAGRVSHEDLPVYYSASDVLAVPSHYESFGLVALEALACGTPIVATPVGAMNALLADGRGGLLVAPRDPAGLAEGIRQVLEDRVTGGYTSGGARSLAMPFGWDVVAAQVETEYARLLSNGVSGARTAADGPAALRRRPDPFARRGAMGTPRTDLADGDRRPRRAPFHTEAFKEAHDYGTAGGCLGGGGSSR